MEENPKVSAGAMAEQVGIPIRKIEENIKKLREMQLIKRIGSARGDIGRWWSEFCYRNPCF
jgi:predicted HTH transcriptional regulator